MNWLTCKFLFHWAAHFFTVMRCCSLLWLVEVAFLKVSNNSGKQPMCSAYSSHAAPLSLWVCVCLCITEFLSLFFLNGNRTRGDVKKYIGSQKMLFSIISVCNQADYSPSFSQLLHRLWCIHHFLQYVISCRRRTPVAWFTGLCSPFHLWHDSSFEHEYRVECSLWHASL